MLKNGTLSRAASSRSNNPNPNPNSNAAASENPKSSKTSSNVAIDSRSKKQRSESASTSVPKTKDTKLNAQSPPELSDTGSEETDLGSSEGDDSSWISWFCGLRGNELLCEVDEDYIQDDFNLCGLQGQVPYYDYALDMILDSDSLSGEVDGEEHSEIESAAELLYGLIHARYILTSKGLNAMHEKYKRVDFGRCPRVYCGGQPCLPLGSSDIPRNGSVKIYCPKCEDLYFPRCKYQSNTTTALNVQVSSRSSTSGTNSRSNNTTPSNNGRSYFRGRGASRLMDIDGAYIGTTFPHLYLMTYPSAKPAKPVQAYVPRVFGFKLHKGPR